MFKLLWVCSALFICVNPSQARECRFPVQPTVTYATDREIDETWTLPDQPVFESAVQPKSPELNAFRKWVRDQVDPEQIGLLKRQRALYAQSDEANETIKHDLVISGKFGKIGPARCLEGLLFAEHEKQFPNRTHPSEFCAFVLTRARTQGGADLRIYYSSHDDPMGSGPDQARQMPLLEADLTAGWKILYHLHNHPFFFANDDIAGTTIPSGRITELGGDIAAHREMGQTLGLPEARITNGFDTLRYLVRELDRIQELPSY